jgi:5-aminolevulinate synthase
LENVRYLRNHNEIRIKHQQKVKKLKLELQKAHIKIVQNQSHIISIIIGDAIKCREVSQILLNDYKIYVQNINFPTVEIGTERLRIIPTPLHSNKMIDDLVSALKEIFKKLNIS